MIRIVGVQRSTQPEKEFVLLQNQGVRRIPLLGYLITDDLGIHSTDPRTRGDRLYVFRHDIKLPPSAYVALITGWGEDGWRRHPDGTNVFHAYWGRERSVWYDHDGPIHLLTIANTHTTHPEGYLLRR
ncbi:MAG: hypothetical protein HRF45_07740 [Fimbriimonadia bacterium]|jgi:hypothetical protein